MNGKDVAACSVKHTLAFSLVLSALTASAQAQQSTGSSPRLEEIVVTGQRIEESIIRAAVAVDVIDSATLQDANVVRPEDFLSLIPNVTFVNSSSPGELFVTIRGNTQVREGDSSTALVIDGVQQLGQNSLNQELFALEAIEVLKGPQGALYGRNAIGGAIVIRTLDPNFEEFEGEIKSGIGNGNTTEGTATLSGPLTSNLAFRTGLSHRSTDGFYVNEFTGEDAHRFKEVSAFGRVKWIPNDALSVDIRGRWQEISGGALGWNALLTDGFSPEGGFLDQVYGLFPNATAVDGDNTSIPFEANIPGFTDNRRASASIKVDYEFSAGVLSSVTSYEELKDFFGGDSFPYRFRGGFPVGANALPPGGETQSTYREDKFFQQEIRFSSQEGEKFRYVVGAQYIKYDPLIETMSGLDTDGVNLRRAPHPRGSLNQTTGWTAGEQENTAFGIFANLSFTLTDDLELTVSGRYDRDKKEQQNFVGCEAPAPGEIVVSAAVFCDSALLQSVPLPTFVRRPGASRSSTFSLFQPKVSLRYDISDQASAYASYGVGFKTGGFNPFGTRALLAAFNPNTTVQDIFEQEEAETFEIGLKSDFWDGRARATAAVFYTDTKNAQLLEFRPEATLLAISTADELDMFGAEVDIKAAVTDSLTLQAGIGYTDTEIKEFSGNPANEGGSRPQVPKVTGMAAGTYRWKVTDGLDGIVRVDYSHTGKTYWDWANTEDSTRSAYGLWNARMALEAENWTVSLWAKNLTDEAYNTEIIPILPGLVDALWRAPPRTYGIEFGYQW